MGLYNPVNLTITSNPVATAIQTNVSSNTNGSQLLESNINRKGAIIYNDSSSNLFIKFGGANTISTNSDYSIKINAYGYYEIPVAYTGVILGIWDSAPAGTYARVIEFE